jgi:hypothetical protein
LSSTRGTSPSDVNVVLDREPSHDNQPSPPKEHHDESNIERFRDKSNDQCLDTKADHVNDHVGQDSQDGTSNRIIVDLNQMAERDSDLIK